MSLAAIETAIGAALGRSFPDAAGLAVGLRPLADYQQGDLGSAVCVRAGQTLKKSAGEIGSAILRELPAGFLPEVYMLDEQLTVRLPRRLDWLMGVQKPAARCGSFIVAVPPSELFTTAAEYLRVLALGLFAARLACRGVHGEVRFHSGTSFVPVSAVEPIFRQALLVPSRAGARGVDGAVAAFCRDLTGSGGGAMLILACSSLISNGGFADWLAAERRKSRTIRAKLIEPDWYNTSSSYYGPEELRGLSPEELREALFHLSSEYRPWELDLTSCLRGDYHSTRSRINELAARLSSRRTKFGLPEGVSPEAYLAQSPWLPELILDVSFYPLRLERALLEGELHAFNFSLNRLLRRTTQLLNQPLLMAKEAPTGCFFSNWLISGIGQAVGDMLEVFEYSGGWTLS